MILAGDTGGTSTRLALFTVEQGKLHTIANASYRSSDYANLTEIVAKFVATQNGAIDHAAFGIAGPVRGGEARTPNLPWVVSAAALARELGLAQVGLLNDLEANAWGIAALGTEDFLTLNAGDANAQGNAAVIAAGTGLGEAGLYWDGKLHRPFACEGGHADWAPRDAREIELLRRLIGQHGHVSSERVISGPGLVAIYAFLRDSNRMRESPAIAEAMRERDPAAVIAESALEQNCGICMQALDLFVSLYGAAAGNAALKFMAVGGLYVGGGIAPKLAPKLTDGGFMRAFVDKGRLRPLLEAIPVRVILNSNTALLGAARYAAVDAGLLH